MVCEDIIPALYARPDSSPLWKALCFVQPCVLEDVLLDRFRVDSWIDGLLDPLITYSSDPCLVLGTLLLIRVNGGEAYLTACFRRLYSQIDDDELVWQPSSNGCFSTESTFDLDKCKWNYSTKIWSLVRGWDGPPLN